MDDALLKSMDSSAEETMVILINAQRQVHFVTTFSYKNQSCIFESSEVEISNQRTTSLLPAIIKLFETEIFKKQKLVLPQKICHFHEN